MNVLSKADYALLTKMFEYTEKGLLSAMHNLFSKYYSNLIYKKNKYLIAVSEQSQIGVVAHCDTVFTVPPKRSEIYYDTQKNVIWSPDGLGADDRAGVFIILKLLQKGIKPTIILTTGEENGGLGAQEITKDYPHNEFNLKFLIQLDRRGSNDCVFYHCGNRDFIHRIETYGFIEKYGTFTDISFLAPAWDIAAVNLSVGYVDEHSYQERLFISDLLSTYEKVCRIFADEKNLPFYKYMEQSYLYGHQNGIKPNLGLCDGCNLPLNIDNDGIPIINSMGNVEYHCPECFATVCNDLNWCGCCGLPFFGKPGDSVCPSCEKEGVVL